MARMANFVKSSQPLGVAVPRLRNQAAVPPFPLGAGAVRAPREDFARTVPAMLRTLISLYVLGIFVFLGLFLIYVPRIAFIDAVVSALIWPWGLYRYFIAA